MAARTSSERQSAVFGRVVVVDPEVSLAVELEGHACRAGAIASARHTDAHEAVAFVSTPPCFASAVSICGVVHCRIKSRSALQPQLVDEDHDAMALSEHNSTDVVEEANAG